ncbi:MAG: hypothetical protein JW772_03775 [Candidatus Diapherotrites archaeon]|nr:hypothetical protein [Candidatus Diapherotrites archaeon]
MEQRAQVSFEYLILAMFAILLAISAALIIDALRGISLSAQARILDFRNQTIASLLQ